MADDEILPAEAVKAYHGDLQAGDSPAAPLADDLGQTETASSYSGAGAAGRKPRPRRAAAKRAPAKRPTSPR